MFIQQPQQESGSVHQSTPPPLAFRLLEKSAQAPDNCSDASMPTGAGTPPEGDDE